VGRLDQHQADAVQSEPSAWDVSDGAHLDEAVDAALQLLAHLAGAGAEKSAVREQAGRAQDASCQYPLARSVPAVQVVVAAPCKPDAVPSAAQSFAERAAVAQPKRAEPPDEADSEVSQSQVNSKR